jgi:3-hydroxyisobutyrate dehydrogenase-like beta-hydroxyacid dehydrogenase
MSAYRTIGFIGLGVGEPICRNLVKKSGAAVIAFDLAPFGAPACRRCLGRGFGRGSRHQKRHRVPVPAERKTRARGVRRRWHAVRKDQIVVDLGTSSVNQTRDFARQLQAALAEAVAVAKSNGVDPALLLDTLSKGSADSFALRNHGMKAIVPGNFPDRAFSTEYA